MLKYNNTGYTITIHLPDTSYDVVCTYIHDEELNQYKVTLWLHWDTIDDKFKIDEQLIDSQYITSTKKSIKTDICKIVEQLFNTGRLDKYMNHYQYTYDCFDIGNDLVESGKEIVKHTECINDYGNYEYE